MKSRPPGIRSLESGRASRDEIRNRMERAIEPEIGSVELSAKAQGETAVLSRCGDERNGLNLGAHVAAQVPVNQAPVARRESATERERVAMGRLCVQRLLSDLQNGTFEREIRNVHLAVEQVLPGKAEMNVIGAETPALRRIESYVVSDYFRRRGKDQFGRADLCVKPRGGMDAERQDLGQYRTRQEICRADRNGECNKEKSDLLGKTHPTQPRTRLM